VQSLKGPKIYDESTLKVLFDELADAATTLLEMRVGRRVANFEHVHRVAKVVRSLKENGKLPPRSHVTQREVAEELGIEPRDLRKWHASIGLTWREFLRASEWMDEPESISR